MVGMPIGQPAMAWKLAAGKILEGESQAELNTDSVAGGDDYGLAAVL